MVKLIIGYCRVSSNKQFSEGHALERYIESLVRFGIPESLIYFDVESGVSDSREGFNAVLDLVKSGPAALSGDVVRRRPADDERCLWRVEQPNALHDQLSQPEHLDGRTAASRRENVRADELEQQSDRQIARSLVL